MMVTTKTEGCVFYYRMYKGKQQLLGKPANIAPITKLSAYGVVVQKYIENIKKVYSDILVDRYVIAI